MFIPLKMQLRGLLLHEAVYRSLLWLSSVEILEAKTDEELREVYSVRYKIYFDEGYVEQKDSGLFSDDYDPYAVNYLIRKRGNPIGTFRIIRFSQRGFQTENFYHVEKKGIDDTKAIEISRFAILKEHRGGMRLITMSALGIINMYCHVHSIYHVYLTMSPKLAGYYQKFGIVLIKLNELELTERHKKEREVIAGYFDNKVIYPYVIDIIATRKALNM